MNHQNKPRKILGISTPELISFIGFYIFWAFFYHVAISINSSRWINGEYSLLSLSQFMSNTGVDYIVKAIITYPIWYLLFKTLKHWRTRDRLLMHLALLPAFVLGWQQIYYVLTDWIGYGHLRGPASAWDIYIPALFYTLQFGVFHAYNYHLENQEKLKLEGELRTAGLKSELSAIKAQLNPHFLYNVFNTISASVPSENEKTRHMIAELSDLFRYQLKASQVDQVSLKEELEFINKYLELEKERFEERLNIKVDVDEEIMNEMIPPMLLQPLVENSIKHGLSSLIEGGTITLRIKRKEEKLFFEISDTGIGVEDKEAVFDKGIGLTNTKLRLEKLYQTTLKLSDNNPRGLKISFEI